MIREHDFNTRWWGNPVGIVDDPAFFALGHEERAALLNPFDWVEFKAGLGPGAPLDPACRAGFFQVDTQLPFSINLKALDATPSTESMEIAFAADEPFDVTADDLASFTHERFRFIPGCGEERINQRYALWTNDMVRQYPDTCIQASLNGTVQGWFLAHPGNTGRLHLTLAMLSREATVSGLLLYHAACLAFARRGYRLGEASFSVTNTAVHNMYAMLRARFLAPVGQWLWVADATRDQEDA